LWVVVDGKVYDLTKFHAQHPGGPEIILTNAGKDGTKTFTDAKHPKEAIRDLQTYVVGEYV
jgi:cytochrome b involved in lipid metabolism